MFSKLSENDLQIILKCIKFVLDSDYYCPEEFGTIIGITEQELRIIIDILPLLASNDINQDEIKVRYGVSIEDIIIAINNSLLDVWCGSVNIDDDVLETDYNISRKDIKAVFHKFREVIDITSPSEDNKFYFNGLM